MVTTVNRLLYLNIYVHIHLYVISIYLSIMLLFIKMGSSAQFLKVAKISVFIYMAQAVHLSVAYNDRKQKHIKLKLCFVISVLIFCLRNDLGSQ